MGCCCSAAPVMALANLLPLTTKEQLSQPCCELDRAKSKARRVASPIQALPGRSGRCRSTHRPTFMLQSAQRQSFQSSPAPRHGPSMGNSYGRSAGNATMHTGVCSFQAMWGYAFSCSSGLIPQECCSSLPCALTGSVTQR